LNNLRLILGGPGCGKTTRLLEIVEAELQSGVRPSEIAFCTFTKAAAKEAQQRAAEKFGLDADEDLPWFRTIHSLAYKALGITRDEVMGWRDWKEFADLLGCDITGHYNMDTLIPSGTKGDRMLRVADYAATTMISLEEAWHELGEAVDWRELVYFDESFSRYKSESSKIDFTDMLVHYLNNGDPLGVRVGIVDEAQDLTASQWAAIRRAFAHCERVYVGGDDDQAIYRWAGADVEQFLRLSRNPEVLPVSHRLPKSVFKLANEVSSRITHRYAKNFLSTARKGVVERHMEPEFVDLSSGKWLLLARNQYMLDRLIKMARDQGVNYQTRQQGIAANPKHVEAMLLWEKLRAGKKEDMSADEVRIVLDALGKRIPQLRELRRYTPLDLKLKLKKIWHDALLGIPAEDRDFYVSCLRRGEKLTQPPRVRIETIHGVKGAEEDNVMIMTDLSTRTYEGFQVNPDHEHRVFYVGVTRAKSSLHIVAPQSDRFYPI